MHRQTNANRVDKNRSSVAQSNKNSIQQSATFDSRLETVQLKSLQAHADNWITTQHSLDSGISSLAPIQEMADIKMSSVGSTQTQQIVNQNDSLVPSVVQRKIDSSLMTFSNYPKALSLMLSAIEETGAGKKFIDLCNSESNVNLVFKDLSKGTGQERAITGPAAYTTVYIDDKPYQTGELSKKVIGYTPKKVDVVIVVNDTADNISLHEAVEIITHEFAVHAAEYYSLIQLLEKGKSKAPIDQLEKNDPASGEIGHVIEADGSNIRLHMLYQTMLAQMPEKEVRSFIQHRLIYLRAQVMKLGGKADVERLAKKYLSTMESAEYYESPDAPTRTIEPLDLSKIRGIDVRVEEKYKADKEDLTDREWDRRGASAQVLFGHAEKYYDLTKNELSMNEACDLLEAWSKGYDKGNKKYPRLLRLMAKWKKEFDAARS